MKTDLFYIPGSLRVERIKMREGPTPVFICWKPDTSQTFVERKALLKFVAWPKSTPTGVALREWLDSLEEAAAPASSEGVVEQSWGPEAHEPEPQEQTRMVT